MKAYQFERSSVTFTLRDVPIPEPGPQQVLLQVEAAGLCHSDTHFLEGKMMGRLPDRPLTLGHEVAGVIVKLGSDVSGFSKGDRVAVCLPSHPVESSSWEKSIGLAIDGGYAEFAVPYSEHLIKIPDNVSFEQAATSTDAIATAYHAVDAAAGVTKDSTVAVIGLGGLGMNALAIAALRGAKVYGIDTNIAKHEEAKALGAVACANTTKVFKDIAFDAVLDFVGISATANNAVRSVKVCGTVVVVGLGGKEMALPTEIIVTRNINIQGSIGSSIQDVKDVLSLISQGQLKPKLVEIPFADVGEALLRLGKQEVQGRLFTRPPSSSKL